MSVSLRSSPHSRVPVFPLAAFAAAAVVLGHKLVYALAIPALHQRNELLARTGHGYLPGTTRLVLLAALASAGALFLSAVARGDVRAPRRRSTFLRLALVQVSIFAAMEAAERLAVGAPIASVADHGLFVLGIAAQVLLAFVGAAVLVLIYRAAESVATSAAAPTATQRAAVAVSVPVRPFVAVSDRGPATLRGPPAP